MSVEPPRVDILEAERKDLEARLNALPVPTPVNLHPGLVDMREFPRGRAFSAWLGLVPRQYSSGGKQKLGRTSKMGQRDIRRVLIIGAMSVVQWRGSEDERPGSC